MKLSDLNPMNSLINMAVSAVVVLIVLVGAWWLIIGGPAHNAKKAAEARVEAAVSRGEAEAAKDAIGVVEEQGKAEAATDTQTRTNSDAIGKARGAGAQLDPDLTAVGRMSICGRPSARNTPACKRVRKANP